MCAVNIDLEGKKALIFGIADNKSIAWHIAKKLDEAGCRIMAAYQERHHQTALPLIKELKHNPIFERCDVTDNNLFEEFFKKVEQEFEKFDFIIHSIAFAKKEHLRGEFIKIDKEGYLLAHEVSSYSFSKIIRRSTEIINDGGSIIAMTYYGSEKVIPGYNIMGIAKSALETSIKYSAYDLGRKNIRVNGISAGPIETLASSGISGFMDIMLNHIAKAPIKRKIKAEDVADAALFLCSNLSKSITGEIIFVDGGYNIMGN